MKTKKIVALVLASMMAVSALAACNKTVPTDSKETGDGSTATTSEGPKEIVDFTMFAAMAGKEKDAGNEIMEIIAEKTGVRVKEKWLTGQIGRAHV